MICYIKYALQLLKKQNIRKRNTKDHPFFLTIFPNLPTFGAKILWEIRKVLKNNLLTADINF